MERTVLWAAIAAVLFAGGCRARGTQELLERELRLQEDRIYELENQVADYRRLLCANGTIAYPSDGSCTTDGSMSSSPTLAPGSSYGSSERTFGSSRGDSGLRPPVVEQAPPYKGPPEISPPDPTRPDGQPPRSTSIEGDGPQMPLIQLRPDEMIPETIGPGTRTEATSPAREYGHAVAITLNRQLTTGYNADDRHGDEGISVIIEPRDEEGNIVDVPGDISIVLMDPLVEGQAARVARWDVPLAQAERRIRSGEGIVLRLPWSRTPPRHSSLDVFVRFTTPEGRKLDADLSVDVNLLARREPSSNVYNASGEFVAPPGTLDQRMTNQAQPVRRTTATDRVRPTSGWAPYR